MEKLFKVQKTFETKYQGQRMLVIFLWERMFTEVRKPLMLCSMWNLLFPSNNST